MAERSPGDAPEVQPVRLAPMILTPRHFVGVLVEIPAAYPMMNAVLGAAKAGEKGLGLDFTLAPSAGDELDAVWLTRRVSKDACRTSHPPASSAWTSTVPDGDVLADQGNGGTLAWHDEGESAAKHFASEPRRPDACRSALRPCGDRSAPPSLFAGLMLPPVYIPSTSNLTRKLRMIGAVNLGAQRLAQLVREYKCRFVLARRDRGLAVERYVPWRR